METIHILVVSDNQEVVDSINEMLSTDSGTMVRYHVELEAMYDSALRSLVRNRYDVYLIDQIVPGSEVTGIELIKKANAGGCRSPILLLTDESDEDIVGYIDDSGAAGHINKKLDFHKRTFCNAIRLAIKRNEDVADVQGQIEDLQRSVSALIHAFNRRG